MKLHTIYKAELCANPPFFKKRIKKGTRREGLKYEEDLAKALPGCAHGIWFKYWNDNGVGYCQPDIMITRNGVVIVLEAKRTDCEYARHQLGRMYLPVVRFVYEKPALGIVVAKFTSSETRSSSVVNNLQDALYLANRGVIPTLHWLGQGPL